MQPFQLPDEAAVNEALASDRFLIFKHSERCGVSRHAFAEYRAFAEAHPDTPHGWIDVVGQRPLSKLIERLTGVRHGSPQAIWVVAGRVGWHASHFDITEDALAGLVESASSDPG
jgi:bacillithiol system protein YtxJ